MDTQISEPLPQNDWMALACVTLERQLLAVPKADQRELINSCMAGRRCILWGYGQKTSNNWDVIIEMGI